MNCRNCNQSHCIKKGKRNGRQRYFCKSCYISFQEIYTYEAYNKHTNSFITSLLKEGCGIRSIARVLKISKKTVLSRMLKIAKEIKIPVLSPR